MELGVLLSAAKRWADAGVDLHGMALWWAWNLPFPSMGSLLCHLSSHGKLGTLPGVKKSPNSMCYGCTG